MYRHVPADDMVTSITCSREKHSVDIILSVSSCGYVATDVIDCIICMLLPRECQCMFAKSVNRMQIVSVEVLLYQALFLFAGGLLR